MTAFHRMPEVNKTDILVSIKSKIQYNCSCCLYQLSGDPTFLYSHVIIIIMLLYDWLFYYLPFMLSLCPLLHKSNNKVYIQCWCHTCTLCRVVRTLYLLLPILCSGCCVYTLLPLLTVVEIMTQLTFLSRWGSFIFDYTFQMI